VKEIVTAEDVMAVPPGGELSASPGAVVTPWARELAATRGVRIHQGPVRASAAVVAVGGDHGGFPLKEKVKGILARTGHRFLDLGTFSTEPVDYPDIAVAVALKVSRGEARFGILVDGAGIGSAMAANKVPGVLAAVVVNEAAARNAREHNDANIMTLGAGYIDASKLPDIVEAFLTAECTEERHARRVAKIRAIERDR